jgi:predicted nucleic-acid-binding protein
MIGLDTNILLRLLVDDGSADVGKARGWAVVQAANGEELFVDAVVLAEVAWVLESVFAYTRAEIALALDALLRNAAYRVDGHAASLAALAKFRGGKFDFSDCLIVARGQQAGCCATVTLGKGMRKLAGVTVI